MALPFFYLPAYDPTSPECTLDEDNSRHIVQVLRMTTGEALRLTDGKGALLTAVIIDDHKKKCRVRMQSATTQPAIAKQVALAISPIKNTSRFEWFLEKATEIGVREIIPLLCEHSERQNMRHDRLQNILVSAMLQSQQAWLPELRNPVTFTQFLADALYDQRFIAHCQDAPRPTASLADYLRQQHSTAIARVPAPPEQTASDTPPSRLILIGPEGDFSPKEVELALKEGLLPVTLGDNRLRTETAGVVAATLLCIG